MLKCTICGKEVEVEPKYCCNGKDCGCRGLPINEEVECEKCQSMILLVDDNKGIYSFDFLVNNYKIYAYKGDNQYQTLKDFLAENPDYSNFQLQNVFHPETEDYLENINHMQHTYPLYVKNDNGQYLRVEQLENGIFAYLEDQ